MREPQFYDANNEIGHYFQVSPCVVIYCLRNCVIDMLILTAVERYVCYGCYGSSTVRPILVILV